MGLPAPFPASPHALRPGQGGAFPGGAGAANGGKAAPPGSWSQIVTWGRGVPGSVPVPRGARRAPGGGRQRGSCEVGPELDGVASACPRPSPPTCHPQSLVCAPRSPASPQQGLFSGASWTPGPLAHLGVSDRLRADPRGLEREVSPQSPRVWAQRERAFWAGRPDRHSEEAGGSGVDSAGDSADSAFPRRDTARGRVLSRPRWALSQTMVGADSRGAPVCTARGQRPLQGR